MVISSKKSKLKIPFKQSLFICCVILLTLFACHDNSYLEQALLQAGENRSELEKVLEHYKSDSLKYRAACFLIENMPGHFSYEESEELNRYYNEIDSVYERYKGLRSDSLVKVYEAISGKCNFRNLRIIPDLKCITADYLIDNIERSFDVWENGEWATHLSFDEFCEYILPYKCDQLQELDNWKEYGKDFCRANIDILHHCSQYKNIAYKACDEVNIKLRDEVQLRIATQKSIFPVKRLSSSVKKNIGTCADQAFIATCVMRAKGIPVAIDYTPQWPFRSMGHTWNTLLDNSGRNIVFLGCDSRVGAPHKEDERKAKVFRKIYRINRELEQLARTENYIPELLRDIHIQDVSDSYAKIFDIKLLLKEKTNNQYAYLSVFNNRDWIPIHWGKVSGQHIFFSKMGNNVVYLPVLYGAQGIAPLGNPFLLDTHGAVVEIMADTTQKQNMTLYRKHYLPPHVFQFYSRLNGAKIQASNYADFRDSLTLHTLTAHGTMPGEILLSDSIEAYRYWRYCSPNGAHCTIAELYFFENGSTKPIYGKVIGTPGSYKNEGNRKEFVFDGNILTCFDAPEPSGAWVGMDFGKPVNIQRICYVPRGDGNYIAIGDEYELMYWDNGKWNSLGKKIADDIKLVYEDCPTGALFLLRNHSGGAEERIFTYENGEQIWW